MTSTSADRVVLRGLAEDERTEPVAGGDLRRGTWTRLGDTGVLGDAVTEGMLASLTDRARAAAHAQGYAAGWAEGRRRASESATGLQSDLVARAADERAGAVADQQRLVEALEVTVARCRLELTARYDELAARAVELALEIAEEVLQRELTVATDPGADALRRALGDFDPRAAVTVHLHPADRATLDPAVLDGRPIAVIDDPSLARGDAVARTDDGVVDATVAGAIARVREVLGR